MTTVISVVIRIVIVSVEIHILCVVLVVRRRRSGPEVRDNALIVELAIVRIAVPCLHSHLFVRGVKYSP